MYELVQIHNEGIGFVIYFDTNNKDKIAKYVATHVRELWDIFFSIMVSAAEEVGEDMQTNDDEERTYKDMEFYGGGGKLYPYLKSLDQTLPKKKGIYYKRFPDTYIKLIEKFYEGLSTKEILDTLEFRIGSGYNENWSIKLRKVYDKKYMFVKF
jgi:hypothetical protein